MANESDPESARTMVDAMLQSALMNETAAYLQRGQSFAGIDLRDLRQQWTAAFKKWCVDRSSANQLEMDDLAAELRLRGQEPPYDQVQEEVAAIRASIAAEGPGNPGVREKIDEFLDSFSKPNG